MSDGHLHKHGQPRLCFEHFEQCDFQLAILCTRASEQKTITQGETPTECPCALRFYRLCQLVIHVRGVSFNADANWPNGDYGEQKIWMWIGQFDQATSYGIKPSPRWVSMTTFSELALTWGPINEAHIRKWLQKKETRGMFATHPHRSLDIDQHLIQTLLPLVPARCFTQNDWGCGALHLH